MNNNSMNLVKQLSQYLFWDIDMDLLDVEKNSSQLIQRVLEYGELEDWRKIRDFYGLARIADDCKKLRSLNPKALSFVCAITGTKKEDYRCYHIRQSFPTHWNSWIDEPVVENGVVLASPKDIAALKINAIEGRGSKKDFIDVYMLLQHFSLNDILGYYALKYPNHSILMALKSLLYFEDAEPQIMPKMFISTPWDKMKKAIVKAVNDYQK